ncbi:hypothetical protein ID866_8780 [Astraeus odoratus]|nr:hypothetical protein ID866_8780 [Astraeus odoratus]
MSSNTNSNNNYSSASTPSIASDWMTIPDAQLNWNNNDIDETAAVKFQEKCQCKKAQKEEECKHWEEKEHHKAAEAEQRCKIEEEARACAAVEEKKNVRRLQQRMMSLKKRSACMGCMKLKEKCEWPVVEIVRGGSKQVTLLWGGEKKKRVRKSTMVDDKVVVEGQGMGQPEAGESDVVAEAIYHILEELQGQLDVLENLVKTQQNIG